MIRDRDPPSPRIDDGDDASHAALLARVDAAATVEEAREAVAAFRVRFGKAMIDSGHSCAEARVTGAATLRRVEGGADVPRGWTATSVSL